MRRKIFQYAAEKYDTQPEYLWDKTPDAAVLRHSDNRKWYGIVMTVAYKKLGLAGEGSIDILNVKTDPLLAGSLRLRDGILPGYHMNKGNWITLLLDGTLREDDIFPLIDMSYELTSGRKVGSSDKCSNWIIPANPKYYDIDRHISECNDGIFLWKQSRSMSEGNIVYIYVTAPVSGIRYKCRVLETDIPCRVSDDNIRMTKAMRLKLLRRYDEPVSLAHLREHGVFSVRGPRSMPDSLARELDDGSGSGIVPEFSKK